MYLVNTDAMRSYLNYHLSKLCNGDSSALTKYIIALLKKNQKNKAKSELREFLCEQLDVFLQKKTPEFVDMLLEALKTKSYILSQNSEGKEDSSGTKSSKENPSSPQREECNHEKSSEKDEEKESKKKEQNSPMKHKSPLSEACGSEHQKEIVDTSSKALFDIPIVETSVDYRPIKTSSYMERCSDYDELGYCLRGSNCRYAHGFDAIPLNMEDLSQHHLNFNVNPEIAPCVEGTSHIKQSVSPMCTFLPPLPTSPPPLPPLPPPMLDAALGALEPYNPESPGMSAYYSTPRSMGPPMPPVPGNSNNHFVSRPSETFSHPKPQRTRELMSVPVSNEIDKETPPATVNTHHTKEFKRKGNFDYGRLGPPKKVAKTDTVLELRKVPQHLNTIAKLNSHFSKFGKILNLEIAFDNDPESALVKFASPMEALNAYRSSQAIFNNRFIKVFYHSPEKKNTWGSNQFENTLSNQIQRGSNTLSTNHFEKEKYSTHQTNVSRTVFEKFPENTIREEVKVPFAKELELLRKKQELLKNSIENKKVILQRLMRTKNKKETDYLKKTIETISAQISTLKAAVKKDSDSFKNKMTLYGYGKRLPKRRVSEKEVLDAQLDSYKEKRAEKHTHAEKETEQTDSLLTEASELKEKESLEVVGDDDEEDDEEDSDGERSWRRGR